MMFTSDRDLTSVVWINQTQILEPRHNKIQFYYIAQNNCGAIIDISVAGYVPTERISERIKEQK